MGKRIIVSLLVALAFVAARANTYTASTTGNWSSSATWGGAGVPATGDIAIIPAGKTVTVDAGAGVYNSSTGAFEFSNPSRIEVFGTLNVVGSPSASSGVLFKNAMKFEVYSGGVAKDGDVQGAFNLVEPSTITVYAGGTFYLFPAGGPAPYSTMIFDITVDPFGTGPGNAYFLGDDLTYYNGNNPSIGGPFTVTVPSGSSSIDASFVESTNPSSVTSSASSVGSTTATLNATVGSGGLATNTIQFQYSTNAALSSGVTTVAASPASLAAGSGTSSVTASITGLTGSTTYYYRVGATNSLGSTQGNILSFTTSAPLPVTFIAFSAQPAGNDVDLNWTVGVNQQANTYEVDHSTDGIHFSAIGQVVNDPHQSSYSYTHSQAGPGAHYYRILETDIDGESIYSTVVSAAVPDQDFSVMVLDNARLQINTADPGKAFIELWSAGGARISLQQRSVAKGSNVVDLPVTGLPAGVYVVRVSLNDRRQVTQLIRR